MDIKRAQVSDMEGIKNLLSQVLLVHYKGRPDIFKPNCRKYTDSELLDIIADDSRPIFTATEDGKVLGYAFCVIKENKNDNILADIKTLYIDDLCVDENMRGKHIGKRLCEYVSEYAKNIGCYNVTLNVWTCNPRAIKFYESCGFIPQKIGMEVILKEG